MPETGLQGDIDSFYALSSRANFEQELAWKREEIRTRGFLYQLLTRLTTRAASIRTIVDLGAGNGTNLALALEALPDRRAVAVDVVKPKDFPAELNIEFITASISSPPPNLPYGQTDLVIMAEIIEHLWDTDGAIALARRLLRRGGFLVLGTPNLSSLVNRLALLSGRQPMGTEVSARAIYGRPGSTIVGHIHVFTARALAECLSHNGFEIQEFVTAPSEFKEITAGKRSLLRAIDRLGSLLGPFGSRILVVAVPS